MDIAELVEMCLSGVDRDRVDIVQLDPASVAEEVVVGLSAIVTQLVYNATEFLSNADDGVSIRGSLEPAGYSLRIIDHGVGMSEEFLEGLNSILANPREPEDWSTTSGVQMVAVLAARHGIEVRLEHADGGVTARVSIPHRLLEDRVTASVQSMVASPEEAASEAWVEGSRPLEMDTETFLEGVFGPLRNDPMAKEAEPDLAPPEVVEIRPTPDLANLPPLERPEPAEPLQGYRRAKLRSRVPGRNYSEDFPTSTFTKPGEAAVEIKLALDDFTRGRHAASEGNE